MSLESVWSPIPSGTQNRVNGCAVPVLPESGFDKRKITMTSTLVPSVGIFDSFVDKTKGECSRLVFY